MKTSAILIALFLSYTVLLANAQIQTRLAFPYQRPCCQKHFVFSVDVSGSMWPWYGTLPGLMNGFRTWILSNFLARVSSHRFNHADKGWTSPHVPTTSYIRGLPFPWPMSPLVTFGFWGGTDWDLAINFLTARLSNSDDIHYIMITDVNFSQISLDPSTIINFFNAYRKWKERYGCRLTIYILNVQYLPKNSLRGASQGQDDEQQNIKRITRGQSFQDVVKENNIQVEQMAPRSVEQAQRLIQRFQ